MSEWHEIDAHRVQVLLGGALLWEHDCRNPVVELGVTVTHHTVGTRKGAVWATVNADPLTLSPSLHCDPELGGCGRHGFVTAGRWVPAEP